jgi:hypothetical protein
MGSALFLYFAAVHGLEVLGVDDPAEVPGRVPGVAGALVELAGVVAEEPLQHGLVTALPAWIAGHLIASYLRHS